MSKKHLVCHGATCLCKWGTAPDKLDVRSQTRHFINDKGRQKLIANTIDVGLPFQAKTFGSCKKMNNAPCAPAVTEWKGFYESVTLSNGGKPLLEDSKATCAVGTPGCIEILQHGQNAGPGAAAAKKADKDAQSQLNPLVCPDAAAERKLILIPKTEA